MMSGAYSSYDRRIDLTDLGEFGAIAAFQGLIGAWPANSTLQLEIGIGDDAAVWRPTPGRRAIETTDLLIEEVHFSLRYFSWYDVGWKAMAVNVSDIAAMGGRPLAAFVSAGLRPAMSQDHALDLYRGLVDCAAEYGVHILGGDTVASPAAAVVNVALYGESLDDSGAVLRRDSARPGDAIGVSGPLGASAAFLRQQKEGPQAERVVDAAHKLLGLEFVHRQQEALHAAHVHPRPRVDIGRRLVQAGARCAIDVSDGLLADLGKICAASGVGAHIFAERVPQASPVVLLLPKHVLELALTGGEDYELVACGSEQVLRQAGLDIIGNIADGAGMSVSDGGKELHFASKGYDAFASHQ